MINFEANPQAYFSRKKNLELVDVRERNVLRKTSTVFTGATDGDFSINEALLNFLTVMNEGGETPPAVVIKAGTGAGKTTKTIRFIADQFTKGRLPTPIIHFTPDHAVAEEAVAEYAKHGVEVSHLKGRIASGCKMSEKVNSLYSKNLDASFICADRQNGSIIKCPHYDSCDFIKQRKSLQAGNVAQIVVVPMEYVRMASLPQELTPGMVIFDEAIHSKLLHASSIPTTSFGATWCDTTQNAHTGLKSDLDRVVDVILASATSQQKAADALIETFGLNSALEKLTNAFKLRRMERLCVAKSSKEIPTQARISDEMKIWGALYNQIKALESGETFAGAIHLITTPQGGRLDISIRMPLPYNCPAILLDASADEVITDVLLGDTHEVFFCELGQGEDTLFRTIIVGQGFSKSSLTGYKSDLEKAERTRSHLSKILTHIAKKEAGRKTLFVTNKDVRSYFENKEIGTDFTNKVNPDYAHFGAIKGLNKYQDHETVIIAGKMEYDNNTVVLLARALMDHEDAIRLNPDLPQKQATKRTITTRDGWGTEILVPEYSNEMMARLQNQYREEEIIQVEGRLRAVNRTSEDLRCYIINNSVPNSMIVDQVYHVDDLNGEGIIEQILSKQSNALSYKSIQDERNITRQTAKNLLEDRGFKTEDYPEGFIKLQTKQINKRGAWNVVFARGIDEVTAHLNAQSHMAHLLGVTPEQIEVRA